MRLPHIQYPKRTPKLNQEKFSGIERDVYSGDGSVHDMLNISTSDFPLLSTIPNRKKLEKKYNKPWYFGMAADNGYVIAGEDEATTYPTWSASSQYAVNTTVAYKGKLYDALTAINGNSENKPPIVDVIRWRKSSATFSYNGEWTTSVRAEKNSIWRYNQKFYVNTTGTSTNSNPASDTANWKPYKVAGFWYNGKKINGLNLIAEKKECSYLNGYIVIMPDKMYYNTGSGEFGYLTGTKTGAFDSNDYNKGFIESNGSYQNRALIPWLTHGSALGYEGTFNAIQFRWSSISQDSIIGSNALTTHGIDLRELFKPGDVLTVSQADYEYCTQIEQGTYYVQDVRNDALIFTTSTFAGSDFVEDNDNYDNYAIVGGNPYYNLNRISVTKSVPDMDYLCVANNRMWGCKEDTVYGSALGDCFSWYRYTDESGAVYLETGDAGSFAGCCEYGGYPTFFKQNEMYRVYGNTRSTFSLSKSAEYGIRSDSPHSVCVVNSILFFLSESGVCAYTGGIPSVISDGLKRKLTDAVAGTDGKRYYLMTDDGDGRKMYVYDTDSRIWSCENLDNKPIGAVTYNLKLVAMDVSGEQIVLSHPENATGEEIEPDRKAYIEFNDFYGGSVEKKTIGKVIVRASVNPIYNPLEVYIQYDSDGQWQKIGQIYNQNERKKVSEFSFRPRRCDHYRLRLECKGKFTLYSLSRQTE